MKSLLNRGWKIGVIVWILVMACNIPMAATPVATQPGLSAEDLAGTAVELTLAAMQGQVRQPPPLCLLCPR